MPNRKTVLIIAGTLLTAGAVAAVSAPWERGHRGGGAMMHGDWGDGPRRGMRGWFRGPMTQEKFDADMRARFARLDKNNDGFIDASEIEERMSRDAGKRHKHGRRMRGHMLRRFDTDRDGQVTRDEYLNGIRTRFARFDLNNDGRITDDDLPPVMRGRGVLTDKARGPRRGFGRRILRFVRDADADKDGAVTLEEVVARAQERFARFERTGDGTIDKADADALRKEMIDYRVKRFIHRFGADAEGKVSRDQFLARAKERFARLDLDNDGTISRSERPGWHGRRGWHGRGEHRRGGWRRGRDRDRHGEHENEDTGQSDNGAEAKDSK